jgi:hypothetical protein
LVKTTLEVIDAVTLDEIRDFCKVCKNGFRKCAAEHQITRCSECPEFPCKRLKEFSRGPIIDGICNHADVIPDLQYIKNHGVEQYLLCQVEKYGSSTVYDRSMQKNIKI